MHERRWGELRGREEGELIQGAVGEGGGGEGRGGGREGRGRGGCSIHALGRAGAGVQGGRRAKRRAASNAQQGGAGRRGGGSCHHRKAVGRAQGNALDVVQPRHQARLGAAAQPLPPGPGLVRAAAAVRPVAQALFAWQRARVGGSVCGGGVGARGAGPGGRGTACLPRCHQPKQWRAASAAVAALTRALKQGAGSLARQHRPPDVQVARVCGQEGESQGGDSRRVGALSLPPAKHPPSAAGGRPATSAAQQRTRDRRRGEAAGSQAGDAGVTGGKHLARLQP